MTNQSMMEYLKTLGINSAAELKEAIKKQQPLNIGIFVGEVKKDGIAPNLDRTELPA